MKRFAQLFMELDSTNKTNEKVAYLTRYFNEANDSDKLWTIALLSGKRPKRSVNTRKLREWATEIAQIPLWLFEESYHIVGDLAETISTLVANETVTNEQSLTKWIEEIIALKEKEEPEKKEYIQQAWQQLNTIQCFVFNKIITGSFRVGISKKLMVRALSKSLDVEENQLQHRIMGDWQPHTTSFQSLIIESDPRDEYSKPYPFYLAYALEQDISELGSPSDWQIEHKWDGIRGQLIVRNNELFVWSRGEELVTDKFPEFQVLTNALPNGTVIDGEIIVYKDDTIQDFKQLQTRIGRKNVSKAILQKAPVVLRAYDLLEWENKDIRTLPMIKRRALLEKCVANAHSPMLQISELVELNNWDEYAAEREGSRAIQSEGLMLKRKESVYGVGRKKGDWWKWKVDPLTIDAVMIYAMRGHGRRANLYTDYTFAVWDGDTLVPFTKAYSGLTDAEFRQVDAFVKRNTVERFGPVRSVKPELVFEIAFEGIARSTRHKSGIALRFPRMKRWRRDKPASEANTLQDLEALLQL